MDLDRHEVTVRGALVNLPLKEFDRTAWALGATYWPDADIAVKLDYTVLLVGADVSRPSVFRQLGLPPEEAARVAQTLPGAQLVLELGRYLVGESGAYVCRVIDRKVSRGQVFLVCDGGLHHHLAASGNFGQVIRKNYPVAIGNRMDQAAGDAVSVVGPLCTPLDLLADRMPLAEAQSEWVVDLIEGSGRLPDRSTMTREVAIDQAKMKRRYVNSKRHTIQVDFEDYLRTVSAERAVSRERATTTAG